MSESVGARVQFGVTELLTFAEECNRVGVVFDSMFEKLMYADILAVIFI